MLYTRLTCCQAQIDGDKKRIDFVTICAYSRPKSKAMVRRTAVVEMMIIALLLLLLLIDEPYVAGPPDSRQLKRLPNWYLLDNTANCSDCFDYFESPTMSSAVEDLERDL